MMQSIRKVKAALCEIIVPNKKTIDKIEERYLKYSTVSIEADCEEEENIKS